MKLFSTLIAIICIKDSHGASATLTISGNGVIQKGSAATVSCIITNYAPDNLAGLYIMTGQNALPGELVVLCSQDTCRRGAAVKDRYTYDRNSTGLFLDITDSNYSEDRGWWRCNLQVGDINSDAVLLDVYSTPTGVAYLNPPNAAQDLAYSTVTFACAATGCVYPAPTFTWYYTENNNRVVYQVAYSGTLVTSTDCEQHEGKYQSTLTLPRYTEFSDKTRKTIRFKCGISHDALSRDMFSSSSVQVTFAVHVQSVSLKDGGNTPADGTEIWVVNGTTKTLTVEWSPTTSAPSPTLTCYVNNREQPVSGSTFTFTVREQDHQADVYCRASNTNDQSMAVITNTLKVYIVVPVTSVSLISPIPVSNVILVVSGQQISLHCQTSSGRPAPTVHWYLDHVEQMVGKSNTTGTGNAGLTFTNSFLSLSANKSDNGKTVQCTADNYEGMEPVELSSRPTLNVQYGPGNSISVSNSHYAVTEGDSVGPITCTAECNPPCSFQWLRDDVLINAGPVLELTAVSRVDGGEYDCEASMLFLGESKTSRVSLRIDVYYSPEITTNVGGGTYEVNDNVTLTCTVDAVPDPNITWYRQGDNSPLQSSITTSSTIRLTKIQCNQMSNYICKAENTIGSTEMSNEVLVKCPPRKALPYERDVLGTPGSEVFLRIATVSFRLPSFTWRDPDQNFITSLDPQYSQTVNGASCILAIHSLKRMGSYTVTVSNGVKPDAVFEFTVQEQVSSLGEYSGISVGLSVGLAFAGFVAGSILFSIICLYRKRLNRWQCCRERLYTKPERQTDEHTYSEVTSPPSMEMTGSKDGRPVRTTESVIDNDVQIGQTYVNG